MRVIKIIMAVVSVCAASDQEYHFNTTSDSKKHYFHKIGEDILNTAKNIFKVLDPTKNLTESSNINTLITIHNDLYKITERNYEIYEEIKSISRVTTDSKNISRFFDLNGLTATLYKIRLKEFNKESNKTCDQIQKKDEDNISAYIKNKKELIEFINSFVAKLNTLSVNDLLSNESSGNKKLALKRKLKFWRPETTSEEQYLLSNVSRRVYKGEPAKVDKYTFMASIHIDGKFVCSGSIISMNLIITAASCLKLFYNSHQSTNKSASVRIGSEYHKTGGLFIPIVQVYFHPLYNPANLRNNLAIIKIKRTLYDTKEIKKIKLDRLNKSMVPNDKYQVVIVGWGATDESRTLEPNQQLAFAMLNIYNLEECSDMYSRQYVTERHFCAGFTTKAGGACNKDVGGPGIVKGLLVGIISFGPAICGNPDEPTVFTKIGSYIAWISEIIKQVGRPSESQQKRAQNLFVSSENTNSITKLPDMKTYYKDRPSVHKGARDEAISIVKTIINEIVLTSKDRLSEALYTDLYDDFNKLYLKSVKQNIEELDDSIIEPEVNSDEDSEYYDDNANTKFYTPMETTVTASPAKVRTKMYTTVKTTLNTEKYKEIETTPKYSVQNKESDCSSDVSDSKEEVSDNYEDYGGLSIEIPTTELVPYSTKYVPQLNTNSQQDTTDIWGLPEVLLLWNVKKENKKEPKLNHIPPKRYITKLRPKSRGLGTEVTKAQTSGIGKGKYISDDENDYDIDVNLRRHGDSKKQPKYVT